MAEAGHKSESKRQLLQIIKIINHFPIKISKNSQSNH